MVANRLAQLLQLAWRHALGLDAIHAVTRGIQRLAQISAHRRTRKLLAHLGSWRTLRPRCRAGQPGSQQCRQRQPPARPRALACGHAGRRRCHARISHRANHVFVHCYCLVPACRNANLPTLPANACSTLADTEGILGILQAYCAGARILGRIRSERKCPRKRCNSVKRQGKTGGFLANAA